MAPTLAFAVLAGALIAGDPDMEWSTDSQPGSAAPEVTPAPAPPPAARAPLEAGAPSTEISTPVDRTALDKNFRAMLELDGAVSPSGMGQLGAGFELDWYALRFLRLHAMIGGSWVPQQQPNYYPSGYVESGIVSHGALKLFAGVDGVLPFAWGELFAGLDSGVTYTSAAYNQFYGDCFGGCSYPYAYEQWALVPAARVRAGVDFTLKRPLVVGFDVGYGLFAQNFGGELHWAELHARLGFAF